MATHFKEVKYNLSSLIDSIDIGSIGLPDIQRPFVWRDTKVRDLFDSMYKGYPVGFFLFWQNYVSNSEKTIGVGKKQKYPNLLIVDGQQRLTSLYAVIKGVPIIRKNYDKVTIKIAFNPLEEKFEIPDASIRRNPRFYQNISELWAPHSNLFEIVYNFTSNLKRHVELTKEEEIKIQDSFTKLVNLNHYPFSSLELSPTIDEEKVSDIFVRINSKGKVLNRADFILTLMSVFWEEGRTELETFCKDCRTPTKRLASPFNYLIEPDPDQMLRVSIGLAFRRARLQYVYSILRGKDLETGRYSEDERDKQFDKLKEAQSISLDIQTWHEFIKTIKIAGFSRQDYIGSRNNLMYSYVLFLIGKHDYNTPLYDLKNLIARWFFMSLITGRYSNSPESTMESDFLRLRDVRDSKEFISVINGVIDNQLTNDYWDVTLPDALAISSATSPSLYGYYAALHILGANGLFSRLSITELLQEGLRSNKSALERHHLFPKAYLQRKGIVERREINQIANYALVEWSDNIAISDSSPEEYLPKYLERFTQEEVDNLYYWHALPDDWEQMSYIDFLKARRTLMSQVIKDAFQKLSSYTVANQP